MKKVICMVICSIIIVSFSSGKEDPLRELKFNSRKIIPENGVETMEGNDPDYVKVENIYGHKSKWHFIQYRIGFEKSGLSGVNSLMISFALPRDIKMGRKSNVHFYLQGRELDGKVYASGHGKVKFTFHLEDKHGNILRDSVVQSYQGYLEFCTYTKHKFDVKSCGSNLRLYGPEVIWNGVSSSIARFEDLFITDHTDGSCFREISDTCTCDCKRRIPWLLIGLLIYVLFGLIGGAVVASQGLAWGG